MTIEFCELHLIIEDKSPSLDILEAVSNQNSEVYISGGVHYLISTCMLEDQYFWFYAQYGKSLPYCKTVYNTERHAVEENPRTTVQVETAKQLFGLYDFKNKVLYFSNIKKKRVLESYLNSQINKKITIKTFFINIDEFCAKIKKIRSIKFVAKRNLFNSNGDILKIFPCPNDLYGLGMPEDFSLEATFSNASITKECISSLKRMVGWKKNQQADSLVCIGLDDKNIETIFNIDSLIQKISISDVKNEQGMYNPELVCSLLVNNLKVR